jgi:hypothetical protein
MEGHNARGQKRPNQRVQELDRRQHFDFNPACTAALPKSLAIEYRSRTLPHESCHGTGSTD